MKIQPIYLFPIALFGVCWFFAFGLLLPGFVLAAIILALAAFLYGADSPLPPLSKEEELAMWSVKWELNGPTGERSAPDAKAPAPRQMRRGTQ